MELRAHLASGALLLLDGALGTELERRGFRAELPLWSAHALIDGPQGVRAIHACYCAAGADVLTANTFRTQARVLARAGAAERAGELTALAVRLAREAAEAEPARVIHVVGSVPPLEDCYRPDLVPGAADLDREHHAHIGHLLAAGVDGVLVETMNTVREAVAACRAVAGRAPLLVSFACSAEARLLSGEPLGAALDAVSPFEPSCVAVNCLPPSAVEPCLAVLGASGLPFGVYPNLGAPGADGGARSEALSPEAFARRAAGWRKSGARLIGGCCGTTPAHISALAAAR